jgi:GT2 family glycosyltransferase
MREINICIPTLNRYDLLEKLIESVTKSTIPVTKIFIIDNGCGLDNNYLHGKYNGLIDIQNFGYNLGVAASWNWFGKYVKEYRLICNDDIEFHPETIGCIINNSLPDFITYPAGVSNMNSFSCFLWNDDIIEKVGYFDETISPNYGYYEDNDYSHRMSKVGIGLNAIQKCTLNHLTSSTIKAFTTSEMSQHHKKFRKAQENYKRKWGGLPGQERFDTPYKR